jgi:hypothetical protein
MRACTWIHKSIYRSKNRYIDEYIQRYTYIHIYKTHVRAHSVTVHSSVYVDVGVYVYVTGHRLG